MNPFGDWGIIRYDQFCKYQQALLISPALKQLQEHINSQLENIKTRFMCGDRVILNGVTGIGKTTSLYYIKQLADNQGVQTVWLNWIPTNDQHFHRIIGRPLKQIICGNEPQPEHDQKTPILIASGYKWKPTYLLIDIPDQIDRADFRKFLGWLEEVIKSDFYEFINIVIALNRPEYNRSWEMSQIFGKFKPFALERFDVTLVKSLLKKRLGLANLEYDSFFGEGVSSAIMDYSKGVPRNVLTAANGLIKAFKPPIEEFQARQYLDRAYPKHVIEDRIEDPQLKREYQLIVDVVREGKQFDGKVALLDTIQAKLEISKNTARRRVDDLIKMGVLQRTIAGATRRTNIISLS